ncbi:MAG: peroxiredoxin family protein [Candidatus Limnocylindria bacterium]
MSRPQRRIQRRSEPRRAGILSQHVGPVPLWAVGLGALALIVVVGVAAANTLSGAPTTGSSEYAVGDPGVGQEAPDFTLPSATGGTYQLSAQRGKTVLLFFHEGLMCAPCWQQVADVQRDLAQFTALGVDQVVAISIDPLEAQAQHARQAGVSIPALADVDRSVSRRYDALSYGMMQGTMPGHTFILVGADGIIQWRADYGGPPNFTMYVPNQTLLVELQRVLAS